MTRDWPTNMVSTYAMRKAGTGDIADALTKTFKGIETTLATAARYVISMEGDWTWGDIPAGTKVTLTSASNAGFNGIQFHGRTENGNTFNCGWNKINETLLLRNAKAAQRT